MQICVRNRSSSPSFGSLLRYPPRKESGATKADRSRSRDRCMGPQCGLAPLRVSSRRVADEPFTTFNPHRHHHRAVATAYTAPLSLLTSPWIGFLPPFFLLGSVKLRVKNGALHTDRLHRGLSPCQVRLPDI